MATTTRETLKIDGMSCGHCVKAVQQALEALDGVDVHAVTIGSADISYDPAAVDRARIEEAVDDAGYTVLTTA